MNERIIDKEYLIENNRKIKKVYLMYLDGDNCICDCCNKKKDTVKINMLCGDVAVLCKDCLQELVDTFKTKTRKKLVEKIFHWYAKIRDKKFAKYFNIKSLRKDMV